MKNKKGKSELEMIFGAIIFVIIMIVFISSGVFREIIKVFNTPEFGGLGAFLGILFIIIIIIAFFEKLFGK